MSTNFSEIRGQTTGIDVQTTAPSNPVAGQIYFDTTTKKLYVHNGSAWKSSTGTTTSTSTSLSTSTSTSTSSTSTSSSSTSTTSSSTSTTSTSTSTTL